MTDRYDPDEINRAFTRLGAAATLDRLGVDHKREGNREWFCCPWHADRTPSANLALGPAGTLRATCYPCDRSGDVLALAAALWGIETDGSGFADVLKRCAGLAGVGPAPEGFTAPRRPEPPPSAPPSYAPVTEVATLLAASGQVSADPVCSAALEARGISPGLVDDLGLAVAFPRDGAALPRWARKAGRSWVEQGYLMGLPVYAVVGATTRQQKASLQIRGIRAWSVIPNEDSSLPKRVAPAGCETRGLVLASLRARRYLEDGEPCRLVVVEGEPDFLSLATSAAIGGRDWGVLGVVAGSWTQALADLIPDGSVVAAATHDDPAGDRYAKAVADSAGVRFVVVRAPPQGPTAHGAFDLNDMLQAGTLAAFDPFKGAPAPGGLPKGEVEGPQALAEWLREFREGRPDKMPISTGFRDLDYVLHGGFRRGDLWVLGGRTSQGKTACSFSIIAASLSARSPNPCAIWSVETTHDDAIARILSRQSGLAVSRLRGHEPGTEAEMARLIEAANPLAPVPWRLADRRATVEVLAGRIAAFVAHVRRRGYPTCLVVVDYVQRLGKSFARHTMREHVMHVCNELKNIAMDNKIAILALSQVSREVEHREDKRPTLADLSESSSLEQDADGVIGVFRPGFYDHSLTDDAAELIVLKNRHGPIDRVRVKWIPETSSYHDDESYR